MNNKKTNKVHNTIPQKDIWKALIKVNWIECYKVPNDKAGVEYWKINFWDWDLNTEHIIKDGLVVNCRLKQTD